MIDFHDKLEVLTEDYGVELLLEQNEINPYFVVRWLVEEGLIDLDMYFEDHYDEEE